jgi:YD repeat-containing protein
MKNRLHILLAASAAFVLAFGAVGCRTTPAQQIVPSASQVQAITSERAEGVGETTRGASVVSERYDAQGNLLTRVSAQGFSAADTEQSALTIDEQQQESGTVIAAFRLSTARSAFDPTVAQIRATARVQLADTEGKWTGKVAEITAGERIAIVTETGRVVTGLVDRFLPTNAAIAAGQSVLANVLVRDDRGVAQTGTVLDATPAPAPAP